MNPDKDTELNRILVGAESADYIEGGKVDEEPGPSPELVGAVVTPTVDAVSAQRMASHKGRKRVTQIRVGSCQGSSLCFSLTLSLN